MNNPLQPTIELGIDWEALIQGITEAHLELMGIEDESALRMDLKDDDREEPTND